MTYRILSAVKAWAIAQSKDKSHGVEYRAALCTLCDAIRTLQRFH